MTDNNLTVPESTECIHINFVITPKECIKRGFCYTLGGIVSFGICCLVGRFLTGFIKGLLS